MNRPDDCPDCEAAMERLYELLDRELTPEVERQVRAHIESCAKCFQHYEFEATFKRVLKARASVHAAPEHLRRKIFDQLLESGEEIADKPQF